MDEDALYLDLGCLPGPFTGIVVLASHSSYSLYTGCRPVHPLTAYQLGLSSLGDNQPPTKTPGVGDATS